MSAVQFARDRSGAQQAMERAENVKHGDDDRNVSLVAVDHHPHEAEMPGHDECERANARKDEPTEQRHVVGRVFRIQNARCHPENFIVCNQAPDCGVGVSTMKLLTRRPRSCRYLLLCAQGLAALSFIRINLSSRGRPLAARHPGLFRSRARAANLLVKPGRKAMQKALLMAAALILVIVTGAVSAERPTRFWNLTHNTISEFQNRVGRSAETAPVTM